MSILADSAEMATRTLGEPATAEALEGWLLLTLTSWARARAARDAKAERLARAMVPLTAERLAALRAWRLGRIIHRRKRRHPSLAELAARPIVCPICPGPGRTPEDACSLAAHAEHRLGRIGGGR